MCRFFPAVFVSPISPTVTGLIMSSAPFLSVSVISALFSWPFPSRPTILPGHFPSTHLPITAVISSQQFGFSTVPLSVIYCSTIPRESPFVTRGIFHNPAHSAFCLSHRPVTPSARILSCMTCLTFPVVEVQGWDAIAAVGTHKRQTPRERLPT